MTYLKRLYKICREHKWIRISYGKDEEYFQCVNCGKQDWT